MEGIKEAFVKVKNDIDLLKKEFYFFEETIRENRLKIIEIFDLIQSTNNKIKELEEENIIILNKINDKNIELDKKYDRQTQIKTDFFDFYINTTDNSTRNDGVDFKEEENKTDAFFFKPLNGQNQQISIGNEGVKTDKQTDKQTDKETNISSHNQNFCKNPIKNNTQEDYINSASDILDSLDSIKKEIRLKFRRLTDQEMLVFSTIYQQEDEFGYSDYKLISRKLSLTESSIRDYVRRLINKGIPIDKNKINNKEIQLFISPNLKKIASLDTILSLKSI